MLDKCLNTIGPNVKGLIKSDKEVFYSEVKHLVKIIQWTKEKYLCDQEARKNERFKGQGMDIDAVYSGDSSEEEKKDVNPDVVRKLNGTFEKVRSTRYPKNIGKDSYYPNLQNLKNLLTIDLMTEFPKLSLLAYEALHDYMEVFDNDYVSFLKQCQLHRLIAKIYKNGQEAQDFQVQDELFKRCMVVECGDMGRDAIIRFYIRDYKKNLNRLANDNSRLLENRENNHMTGEAIVSNQRREEDARQVDRLNKKRKMLTKQEIIFIVDFLIDVCKYY